ncbi:phosphatase PAP2 family protein [Pseudonocardia xishanensis]|uniref:Phosphatidic acid phosphatase type 2/haloperoxidase domain-containing protein n=1 Tax=Pseudonocardia xishanensis TaxID=630995 RepID=A0ABP8RV06_9PSEU
MSTADATLTLALSLLAVWVVLTVVALLRHRVRGTARAAFATTGAAAVAFALYAGVVDAVADPAPLAAADGPVLAWFVAHRTPFLDVVMLKITNAGGTLGMTVLTIIGLVVLLLRRRVRDALVLVVTAIGAGTLVGLTKNLYQRERPPLATRLTYEPTYSLPSGHSLSSFAVLGMLAIVLVLALRSTVLRSVVVVLATLAVLAIGTSRLYLGVHWFTDVLAGWLLGGAWLALCCTVPALRLGARSASAELDDAADLGPRPTS